MTPSPSGQRDLVDRLTEQKTLAQDFILPNTSTDSWVSTLEEWDSDTRGQLLRACCERDLRYHYGSCYAGLAECTHWEFSRKAELGEAGTGSCQAVDGRLIDYSSYSKGEDVIRASAAQQGRELRVLLECRMPGFYPLYAHLAQRMLTHLDGAPVSPVSLPRSVSDLMSVEITMGTDAQRFHAWLAKECSVRAAWIETDILGFYDPEFSVDPSGGRVVGRWNQVRKLWRDDDPQPCHMVGGLTFLTSRVSKPDKPSLVAVCVEDARYLAPWLRLLADAVCEFPVGADSKPSADRYRALAELVQQAAPLRTAGTLLEEVERGSAPSVEDAWDEVPERMHLLAGPKEYAVWLVDQTASEEGLLRGYKVVEWGRDRILLQSTVASFMRNGLGYLKRGEYVALYSLERAPKGQVGIIVTARCLSSSSRHQQDLLRALRRSMDYFGGSLLPPLPETLGSQPGAAEKGPSTPAGRQPPEDSGISPDTPVVPTDPKHLQRWKDASPIIEDLHEQGFSNLAIAGRLKRFHPELRIRNERTVALVRRAKKLLSSD